MINGNKFVISFVMKKITINDRYFSKLFKDKLSAYLISNISNYKLVYSPLTREEEEKVIIKIIEALLDSDLVQSGAHRLEQWERGWDENLADIRKMKITEAISPHYYGKYKINRLNLHFVKGVSANYEKNMLYVILDYVFDKYLREVDNIYDFGCGTGHILVKTREVNPTANLVGLDWTKSSQKILKKISDDGLVKTIKGYNFNFFRPNSKIKLARNSGVYTVAALEQLGSSYIKFVSYLLKNKPKICIHVEPIAELLDESKLIDYLSIRYFRKRKYLSGYLDYLRKLEREGKIKIHEAKRTFIGSMFIEGYSIIVWSPTS